MRDSQTGIYDDPAKYGSGAFVNKENGGTGLKLKSRKSRHNDEMDEA